VNGVTATFRFHGELNDFLPPPKRETTLHHPAGFTDSLKHVLESIGVPHTEIGRARINGKPVELSERLKTGDDVEIFPHTLPICLETPRFVADGHLGRLAAYLRMLGFDTWYERFADDAQLAEVSSKEQRLLLTRDVGLLKRREVRQGYCVRAHKPHEQLREVSGRFALRSQWLPFQRCMDCNGRLTAVAKSEVTDLLPLHTRETKDEFSRCLNCGKVYWRGTHYERMAGWIRDLGQRD
jgi:uncharacterized protein with PIN domain